MNPYPPITCPLCNSELIAPYLYDQGFIDYFNCQNKQCSGYVLYIRHDGRWYDGWGESPRVSRAYEPKGPIPKSTCITISTNAPDRRYYIDYKFPEIWEPAKVNQYIQMLGLIT